MYYATEELISQRIRYYLAILTTDVNNRCSSKVSNHLILQKIEEEGFQINSSMVKRLGDGAHDNYPTYELLNAWDTKAVIPLNSKSKGQFKFSPPIKVNEFGVSICLDGQPMINNGFMKDHCRIKWRCPLGSHEDQCSPSPYGRTVYTKPEWDQRLFTAIPRGSKEWKTEMRKRTSSERVNKRILEDYNLEESHTRGKKRFSWWVTIHSTNIHLDARLKLSKFRFLAILDDLITNKVA